MLSRVGKGVGVCEGEEKVGSDTKKVGFDEGALEVSTTATVAATDGCSVGDAVGKAKGASVGADEGELVVSATATVTASDGASVGSADGAADGVADGAPDG